MAISTDRVDESSLAELAAQAVRLLCAGEISALAQSFGYAIALGREPAEAIAADLRACLSELGASCLVCDAALETEVKYFAANQEPFAVVECTVRTNNGRALLVELVVTERGDQTHVCLEQISTAA